MTLATDIAAAAAEVGASAQAAADRVTASLGNVRAELAAAQQALEDYIDSHPDESGTLQGALDNLVTADGIIDSIEAAPAEEEPPVEEPPVEEVPTP